MFNQPQISFTPIIPRSQANFSNKGEHSQLGFNLDNFQADDDSTLDDKCYNVVEDKQSQNWHHQSHNISPDTFMPNSWHSNLSKRNDQQSTKEQLSPVQLQRQAISDFVELDLASKELLHDQSPDCFSKISLHSRQLTSQSDDLSFEFSGSDVPSQMLCYTTESRPSSLSGCNLQSITESVEESESPLVQKVSNQKVKMVVVDSQNLSSQQQFAQKRKVVEETNLPFYQKLRNKRAPEPPKCKQLELASHDNNQKRSFRMYNDSDIGLNFKRFIQNDEKEPIVDSCQDDDLATDDEVIEVGTQQCFQDLLVMKDWLICQNERQLNTFKFWGPKFNGQLPRARFNV